jgi:hypothetical protein
MVFELDEGSPFMSVREGFAPEPCFLWKATLNSSRERVALGVTSPQKYAGLVGEWGFYV